MKIHAASSILLPALLLSSLAPAQQSPGQWTVDDLAEARSELAATSVGSLALFGGGFRGSGSSSVVDILDASSGAWTTDVLSQARGALAATSAGGLAFFAGGAALSSPSFRVDIYDPATGSWSQASLSIRRRDLAATSVAGKAMFAGGQGVDYPEARVDIYDTVSQTWSTIQLSHPRAELAATTVGDLALFAGGVATNSPSANVDVYDSSLNSWGSTTLSAPRRKLAATSVGGVALFAGGITAGVPRAVVDLYDSNTNTWSIGSLSQARFGLAAVTIGRFALFAGGALDIGAMAPSDVVDIYDSATGVWSTDSLSTPRRSLTATALSNTAFFAGGSAGSGVSDVIDVLNNDCNGNSVPDYTDIESGTSTDCNANLIPDDCDIAAGTSQDQNGNGLPDECEVLGPNYCSPNAANSTGFPAVISAIGTPHPSANDVLLTASSLPPFQFGYFLTSQNQAFVPFPGGSQGALCLANPIGRYSNQIVNSGATGEFAIAIDLTALPVTPAVPVLPGETWNFQCWYRDAGATSNFTDAVSVAFVPDPVVEFTLLSQGLLEQSTQLSVMVTITPPPTFPVSVPFAESGTATAHVDYRVESINPLEIPAGESSCVVLVTIADDLVNEPDETVVLTLLQPTNATLGAQFEHTITIVDND